MIASRRVSSPDFAANSETIALFLFSKRLGPSPHTMTALDLSLQAGATVLVRPKKASKCSQGAGSTGVRVVDEVDADDVPVRRHAWLQWHITAMDSLHENALCCLGSLRLLRGTLLSFLRVCVAYVVMQTER